MPGATEAASRPVPAGGPGAGRLKASAAIPTSQDLRGKHLRNVISGGGAFPGGCRQARHRSWRTQPKFKKLRHCVHSGHPTRDTLLSLKSSSPPPPPPGSISGLLPCHPPLKSHRPEPLAFLWRGLFSKEPLDEAGLQSAWAEPGTLLSLFLSPHPSPSPSSIAQSLAQVV